MILELVVGEGKPPESRHLKRVWFEMWARMIKMDDGFDLEPLTYMHIHAYLGTEGFNDSNDNYIRARIAASPFVSCHSPDYDCVAIMSSPHHELGRSVLSSVTKLLDLRMNCRLKRTAVHLMESFVHPHSTPSASVG